MRQQIKSRGYDDTLLLREMAIGVVTRKYTSVDEAAKAMIGNAHRSNADRLRRKFREQGWYQRGLEEYVRNEAERLSSERAVKPITRFKTPKNPKKSVGLIGFVASITLGITLVGVSQISQSVATEDPIKAAEKVRVVQFAVNTIKGLYDINFVDPDEQVASNLRFFLIDAAFDSYQKQIPRADIRNKFKVFRNEIVTKPTVTPTEKGTEVSFDVEQIISTAETQDRRCFKARVIVSKNQTVSLGSSEFGLTKAPELRPKLCKN